MRVYVKIVVLLLLNVALQAWDATVVDVGVQFSNVSERAIALDSGGLVHGVYGGRQLYHRKSASTEVVDVSNGTGKSPSFVLDANDILHIVYGTDTGVLKCAIGTFGNYHIYVVDTGVNVGAQDQKFSIDVNGSGGTHIVYVKSGTLKHAWFDGDWHAETLVSSDVSGAVSLAIDGNDDLHISYGVSGGLK